ncbi:MAG TPA: response regulator [Clostridia bacterium]|nr:response regulator [Clostridia bacterium]
MRIRTIIADDQLLARESLRRMLQDEPDIEVVGMAAGGREAVDLIQRLQPELAFLDIEMPDLDGFAVLKHIQGRMPAIIFVTASEAFALKAFDMNAVDYLIKPCAVGRLQTAVHRARELIRQGFSPLAYPETHRLPGHHKDR